MPRKMICLLVGLAVLFTMGTAYAANKCQNTLTAPGIIKKDCERVGSVTFTFDAGTTITAGDWWYMDLDTGTSICNPINYIITGDAIANAGAANYNLGAGQTGLVGTGLANGVIGTAGGTTEMGPMACQNTGGGAAADVRIAPAVDVMVFQVTAAASSRRVWIKAFGSTAATTLTVPASHIFSITIMDGFAYQRNIALDKDNDGVYGEDTLLGVSTDTIPADADPQFPNPHVENTLCVNAEAMSGNDMYTSFDSLDNFITFTGDSKIAHVVGAAAITLEACKGVTDGDFTYASQGACEFNYNTGVGYCPGDALVTQYNQGRMAAGGQRVYLQSTSTFGDPGDRYTAKINILTPGVYFGASPGTLAGLTPLQAVCDGDVGTNVALWTLKNEAGTDVLAPAPNTCSVVAADRIREAYTTTFTGIDGYHQLLAVLNSFVYDSSILGYGTEVSVRFSLDKYPCGTIFEDDLVIGTYVEECPVGGVAGSTLMFPYFPAMDGSMSPWWGGFVVVNGSTSNGTINLTFTEATGATATLTNVAVAAGQMYFMANTAAYLATLTADAGFGDENMSLVVTCSFQMAAGFAFLGNSDEGTGYVAYTMNTGYGN